MSNIRVVFLYLVYVGVIAGVTVAIVASLHTGTTPKPTKPSTSQTQVAQNDGASTDAASGAGSSVAGNVSDTNTTTPTTTTASAGQLSNTGPGNVVMIFVVSAVLGTLIHRRFLVAR